MIGVKAGLGPDCTVQGAVPPTGRLCNGTTRQKAQQAVEYYNNNLIKARPRIPCRQVASPTKSRHISPHDALYRSNSSLELVHDPYNVECALRKEYGSHGSIDVIGNGPSSTGESFFAMLQDYRPVVLTADQRSPGPAEYLRHKVEPVPASENAVNVLTDETDGRINTSPKLRVKLSKLWGRDGKVVRNGNVSGADDKLDLTSGTGTPADLEDRRRRRALAHYDCQSLTANLGYAAKLRGLLLARRRNTATGASAASMLGVRSITPDGDSGDEDAGDGNSNDLIESCPFFRNEVGGEEERIVSLTRFTQRKPVHRPPLSSGVSILEFPPGETHWTHSTCPYLHIPGAIEGGDRGALYYRNYFFGQEHQNWFGMDENLGPVAISLKKEKVSNGNAESPFQYRIIVRTSELLTLRGTVLEESMPNLKSSANLKSYNTKEVLEYISPEITLSSLRLAVAGSQTEEQVLKLDEQGLSYQYKVGVMYCRTGQVSEEEMYNNEEAGPAFLEFLDTIGQRVRLKGFDKYRAGLDNKTDSTGLYSVYSKHQDSEVMFHVSTLLPFTASNRQQLLRKRHIGNDIVTVVFQEPGALPFTPRHIRSQFQHVFIVVRVTNPCTEHTTYSVAVTRSKEVPVFGPPIPEGATFPRGKAFAEFLLAKVINAETAAHRSAKFSTMATRTRQEYLKDLASNYVTNTVVESSQKFSAMLSFSSKKKERTRPRFQTDCSLRGAVCWPVVLEDAGKAQLVESFLAVSTDTIVIVDENTRELLLVIPCRSVLGWSIQSNSISLYHHQGECVSLHIRESGERDDLLEILIRLKSVTHGCGVQEMSLKRNQLGQLGFHVQPDGIVTQVEANGQAWAAGLRQGCRLVEICKVAVATLTHDQMVDLLKTSVSVCITVIAPLQDGGPRSGCNVHNCKYTINNYEGDYENLQSTIESPSKTGSKKATIASIQPTSGQRKKYERSFSPPRSSNSSGYGTGSSSKSFTDNDNKFTQVNNHVGSEERWYEERDVPELERESPPPLPARVPPYTTGVLQLARKWESGKRWGEKPQGVLVSRVEEPYHNHHGKLQTSQSLPLSGSGSLSLPVSALSGSSSSRYAADDGTYQEFKVGEKVTQVKSSGERENHVHYHVTRGGKLGQDAASLPVDCLREIGASEGSLVSERIYSARSEDELSNGTGSGSGSPHGRRCKLTNLSSSNGSSRNQSPRPSNRDNGEARLRPGVTARMNNHRNSANLTSSTLQEDLMRLINPDYSSDSPEDHQLQSQQKQINRPGDTREVSSAKGSSSGAASSTGVSHNGDKEGSEVILTTARPATVISNTSTASSPSPSEPKLSKEERLSPRATKYPGPAKSGEAPTLPIPLPGPGEVDWPSLVDTATRAMGVEDCGDPWAELASHRAAEAGMQGASLGQWVDDVVGHLGLNADAQQGRRVNEMQGTISQLESRLTRESRRRMGVEDEMRRLRDEVRSLRDENRRLQEESQAAAQQLRRFTEWFFQTIDRQ